MGILENLENLKKEDLERVIELFCIEKNRNNEKVFQEIEKVYLESLGKLYHYLPIETYNFLELYFENNGVVPDTESLFECVIEFEKFGLCPFEDDDEDSEFIKINLDTKIAKPLYDFLNNNKELISKEIELYNVVSGILNTYLGLKFTDFLEILKTLNIFKAEHEIMDFLKYKIGSDTYDFYFSPNDELFIANRYIHNSEDIIEKVLSYKGERKVHSLNQYINLSYDNIIEDEIENILSTINSEDISDYDDAYIGFYLIRNALFDLRCEDCLKDIKNMIHAIDTDNSIIKENIAKFYNKVPLAFEGGVIKPNRVIL